MSAQCLGPMPAPSVTVRYLSFIASFAPLRAPLRPNFRIIPIHVTFCAHRTCHGSPFCPMNQCSPECPRVHMHSLLLSARSGAVAALAAFFSNLHTSGMPIGFTAKVASFFEPGCSRKAHKLTFTFNHYHCDRRRCQSCTHHFRAHQERRLLGDTFKIDLASHICGCHGMFTLWKASRPVRDESDSVMARDTMAALRQLPKNVPLASPTKC
jgi:hypothetical protein